jgi:molybdopterin molybdotransferase
MLSVAEAQAVVLQHTSRAQPTSVPLTNAALGLVLAEDIVSDIDMPPHEKALMDGFAVRSEDLPQGNGILSIVEEIMAGQKPTLPLGKGQASRIMTGAPLPRGADAVIMVERTRSLEKNSVQIEDQPCRPGQNVMPQGREMRSGETVLSAGTVLRPQDFGILSTVGRTAVSAYAAPQVAVFSTGDELVEPTEFPGPGQIRNGNGPMLMAQVCRAGGEPRFLGIARDRAENLMALVTEGLRSAILVLSGGVSAGKLDLVPAVLWELGVQGHFHKVEMKPGKPIFFGTRDMTLVFGLPGNPVSALVCFELFVRPAICQMMGREGPGPRMVEATLTENLAHKSDRPTYYPVKLSAGEKGWTFQPVPWYGSPDLRSLSAANAFAVFPPGENQFCAGQQFPVLVVDGM